MSRLRTWTLVAGLTGLVIAFGALLGGAFVWLFAALAMIMNAIGYFYSDRIALRVSHAQPLAEPDAPEVHAAVQDLAARAGIPMPRLYVMPGEQSNAFATGRNPEHAAVAMTEGLLLSLPLDQIRGVLAHELAHIRNHDILVSSIAATIAGMISAIANVLALSFLFGGQDDESPLGLFGSLAAMILAPIGAMLLQLGVSRQREYLADATAAQLLGEAAPLAAALAAIDEQRAPALTTPALMASMYILNPLAGGQLTALFSTHPPVRERIRRLRACDTFTQTTRAASTHRSRADANSHDRLTGVWR
ncbi:MAG: M48 family metalloprotease [Solirubrobacteraceae bacterium]